MEPMETRRDGAIPGGLFVGIDDPVPVGVGD